MHQICRSDFNDEKQLNISLTRAAVKNKCTSRSSVGFDWKTNCFICSKQAIIDVRHKDRKNVQELPQTWFKRFNLLVSGVHEKDTHS